MVLRQLNKLELQTLYKEELTETFPSAELKPLSAMIQLLDKGCYEPLGLFEGVELAGYVLLWTDQTSGYVLIDYLGVTASRRNSGLGAKALRMTGEHCRSYRGILAEVEAPISADEDENALRRRRLGFYARNGFVSLDNDCALFGVQYQIMMLSQNGGDAAAALAGYRQLYLEHFPPEVFARYVQIPLKEGETPYPKSPWDERNYDTNKTLTGKSQSGMQPIVAGNIKKFDDGKKERR